MKTPRLYLSPTEFLLCDGGWQTFWGPQSDAEAEAPLQGGIWGGNAQPKEEKQIK